MDKHKTALWWAQLRAAGPQPVDTIDITPPGVHRLVQHDAEHADAAVWLLPDLPANVAPSVLDELGLQGQAVKHPNDTARVLAASLRCCWTHPNERVWPGVIATKTAVASVFGQITHREGAILNRALVAGLRRLAGSGWLMFNEAEDQVQLGPRVASWGPAEVTELHELWRMLPSPDQSGDLEHRP